MIDLRKCPNGIRMDGIAFTQAARELARAQNQNLEIFQWMGNQMQKLSKQVDELEKEIAELRGNKNE